MRINLIKICCQKTTLRVAGLLLLGMALASPVAAGPEALNELQVVNDWELDSMRGGYATSAGLEITFGIETAVFIDGILQAVTSFNSLSPVFNLPDSRVIGKSAGLLSTSGGPLVQSGFSRLNSEAVSSHLFTIVQNSQDHRIIDTITQINATVPSLNLYRQSNLMSSLQQQLIGARR